MEGKYAMFVYDPLLNTLTFWTTHSSREALLTLAPKKFKDHVWFAIYKFSSYEHLFSQQVPASKWYLDTKLAQPDATKYLKNYTPMETAYQIDNTYEWMFKTF
jgi:hypothetical protein